MNKRGNVGEGVMMIYRIFLVSLIAIIILGLSAVFYEYYIDVKEVEAGIMITKVSDCIAPEGVLDLSKMKGYEDRVLDFCKIQNTKRFYVSIKVNYNSKEVKFHHGDSGITWIKDLFSSDFDVEKIKKYELGYKKIRFYPIRVLDEGVFEGEVEVEVYVKNEI